MTLTLNDRWKERAGRDGYEEVYLVSITKGATTWEAVSNLCSEFSRAVAVDSVTPFASEMDVRTRRLGIGGMTVVVDDDWIRDIVVSTRLFGSKIRIRHGFRDIVEADFVEYWTGVMKTPEPEPAEEPGLGVVRIEALNVLEILRQTKITGSWIQEHPLDAIYEILTDKVGIDSTLIDAAAFDPDAAAYTSISHLVVTRSDVSRFYTDGGVREPVPAMGLIDELAMLLNGTLYVNEEGELSFRIFDSTAAVVDTWSSANGIIRDWKQIPEEEDDLFNRVEFNFMPEDQAAYFSYLNGNSASYGLWNGAYVANDTDSQAEYVYPGTSERIIPFKTESPWVGAGAAMVGDTDTDSGGIDSSVTSFVLFGGPVPTFCGTRESGSGSGSQPTNAKISSGRPLYLLTNTGEIIKATAMATRLTIGQSVNVVDDETGVITTIGPFHFRFDISGVTRGALSTTPAAAVRVVDITTQHYLAEQWLKRHSNGIPRLEVTTSLEEWDHELGEFVAVELPGYLGYGLNGLEAGDVKWELIKKEHDPEKAEITWLLASANVTSPTMTRRGRQRLRDRTLINSFGDGIELEDVIKKHVVSGFEVTPTSGLSVSVAAGVASAGTVRTELRQAITLLTKATSDNYIFFNLETATLHVCPVELDAAEPYDGPTAIVIAKVRTNATNVTGITTTTRPTKAMSGTRIVGRSLTGAEIAEAGILTINIADGAATGPKIGDKAITSSKVKEAALGPVHVVTAKKTQGMFSNPQFNAAKKG